MALRVAIAQINTVVGDLKGNCAQILSFVRKAKKEGADIVVFPELTICGYPPEDLLYKEHFIQENLKAVRSLAKKIKDITIVVGFVDVDQKKNLYNAAAVLAQRQIVGVYHKKELPNYGVFDEKRYFSEGQTGSLFLFSDAVFDVSICEDIWGGSNGCRSQSFQKADLIINLSSSPYDLGKLEERKKILTKCAKQNNAFVCYANLIGGQDELVFDGGSLVIDDGGKIIAAGKQFQEDLVVADLPVNSKEGCSVKGVTTIPLTEIKKHKPPLQSHMSHQWSDLERVYKALALGTRDYVQKNGFKKVAIGLSGGIDSSLVAAIACKALGKENVVGISMPSQFSSQATQSDAKKLAEKLGIQFLEIPIKGIFAKYLSELEKDFEGSSFGVAEENLQARIRGNILMAFSNKFGWLVLTTGNKSEVAVGYCTLYGDTSGGFAVIKDIPKTMVYNLAELINQQEGEIIPGSIIDRAPSAELREDQKDQDSLPPYEVLDPLLKAYVEEHNSFAKMKHISKDKETIKKVVGLVDRSEYKRRQSPPGIKITPRAFGKDWRLPITNRYKEF